MTTEKILVPDTGSDGEMEVIEIAVAVGDALEKEQTLIVLESDKATMEIPSPLAGKLLDLKLKTGDKVRSGDLIAEVEVASEDSSRKNKDKAKQEKASADKEPSETQDALKHSEHEKKNQAPAALKSSDEVPDTQAEVPVAQPLAAESGKNVSNRVHAGPSVRKFAREHGVELERIEPSGPRSRILQEDVSRYIKNQMTLAQGGRLAGEQSLISAVSVLPDFKQFGEISLQTMSKIQLKTAENMQRSWAIPQVTQFDEVDISEMEAFRKRQSTVAEQKGIRLTPMAFLLKACAYVLQALPQFNVSLDLARQQTIQKHFIHIAFAVDTPYGLFVPVIRDVDKKGIWQLAAECQDLAGRAREKKLTPAEMQGACFTISSLGAIGGTAFTPIVNFPEVAILGVSKAQLKPCYNQQNELQARLMLPLSLSYDHRAVNGADGARFTTLLGTVLSDLRELLL
jgi:pyruvate dehydrogenase E2 component (dihydrolipoamide acetyltransferase)